MRRRATYCMVVPQGVQAATMYLMSTAISGFTGHTSCVPAESCQTAAAGGVPQPQGAVGQHREQQQAAQAARHHSNGCQPVHLCTYWLRWVYSHQQQPSPFPPAAFARPRLTAILNPLPAIATLCGGFLCKSWHSFNTHAHCHALNNSRACCAAPPSPLHHWPTHTLCCPTAQSRSTGALPARPLPRQQHTAARCSSSSSSSSVSAPQHQQQQHGAGLVTPHPHRISWWLQDSCPFHAHGEPQLLLLLLCQ